MRRPDESIVVALQTLRSLFAFGQLRRDEMAEMSSFNSIGIATIAVLCMLQQRRMGYHTALFFAGSRLCLKHA